jgi:outer membrane protein
MNRTLKAICLSVMLSVSLAAGPRAETLPKVISLALSNNATIRSYSAQLARADEENKAAFRRLWPTIGYASDYKYISEVNKMEMPGGPGKPSTELELSQHDNYDNSLTVSWLIFNGFAKENQVYSTELRKKSAELQYDKARKDIAYRTASTYINIRSLELQQEVLKKGRERVGLQYNSTQAQYRQGLAMKLDLMTLKLALARYDQQLITVEAALETVRQQLQDLVGLDVEASPGTAESTDRSVPPLNISRNEDLQLVILQREQTQAGRNIAAAQDYPDLSVYTSAHHALPGIDPIDNEWMDYSVAGASLQWSLWDWGARWADTAAYDRQKDANLAEQRLIMDRVRLAYNNAVREFKTFQKQQQVLDYAVTVAEDRLRIVQKQVSNGVASATDFRDADADLYQAELEAEKERALIRLKCIELDMLSGKNIKDWRIDHE